MNKFLAALTETTLRPTPAYSNDWASGYFGLELRYAFTVHAKLTV
ncbi:hypothetical protein PEL8287_03465 [Roseovarius litorisediminis]|uniref:Uncharacterized protein n=1 Tax=Roseovarius litorisediminis TaxID=1312363 RepID=A0A1Y5TGQ1_9RHOB|nr:hypothetical protein PEL8287_03465 [Roseovarius litorisediminis]